MSVAIHQPAQSDEFETAVESLEGGASDLEQHVKLVDLLVHDISESDAVPTNDLESDAQIVAQARQDSNAFGLLYERYVDRIYAYIYHRVGNAQDAEDLTARTFYRALDNLAGYEDRGLPFAAWLFRIAHNLVANWHRDRGRRRFLSLDRIWFHRSETDDPENELEKKETHAALWTAINRLPADRRDLLIYKFSSRLSNVEIGQLMDKSEGAIKSLYFRTLASLRKELEGRGWGADSSILHDSTAALGIEDEKGS
jgi:RNA polymerase sigma-70 factor (ECF subfamily)